MFAPALNKFHWQRPNALYRNYELVTGYFQVGGLKFKNAFSYDANGEFEGRQYKIKRSGLFQHKVEVWDTELGGLVAEANTVFGTRGKMTIGTQNLQWEMANSKGKINIKDDKENVLGSFQFNTWKRDTQLELNEELLSIQQRGLIALIGMYLMALYGYR